MMQLTLDAIGVRELPTINQGHYSDLKIDTGEVRVWASRMMLADGETEPVQIEKLVNGRWVKHRGDITFRKMSNVITIQYINRNSSFRRDYDSKIYKWICPGCELGCNECDPPPLF